MTATLQGIQKRFGAYFADKEFLVAAVTHPRFKLSWIDDAERRANCTQKLEAAVSMQMALSSWDTSAEQTGDQSDVQNVRLDDFFNFSEREMEQSQKHLQFLNDKAEWQGSRIVYAASQSLSQDSIP